MENKMTMKEFLLNEFIINLAFVVALVIAIFINDKKIWDYICIGIGVWNIVAIAYKVVNRHRKS